MAVTTFEKQLDDFIQDSTIDFMTFPPTLDSQQRKLIHELCESKGLVSESQGRGSNRVLSVYKSTTQKPSRKLDKLPKGITEVLENFLYQGSARDAQDLAELQKKGIKHILNVTKEWPNKPTKGIKCYTLPIEDILDETVLPLLPKAFSIIDKVREQKEKILVHCVAGKSRSAAVIIGMGAYLMHHQGWPLQVSYNYLIQRRDIVLVNHSFMLQLVEFEKQKYGSSTMKEGDWPIGNQTARKKQVTNPSQPPPKLGKQLVKSVQEWLTDTILRELYSSTGLLDYSPSSMSVYLQAVSSLTIPDKLQRCFSVQVLQACSQEIAQEWFKAQLGVGEGGS